MHTYIHLHVACIPKKNDGGDDLDLHTSHFYPITQLSTYPYSYLCFSYDRLSESWWRWLSPYRRPRLQLRLRLWLRHRSLPLSRLLLLLLLRCLRSSLWRPITRKNGQEGHSFGPNSVRPKCVVEKRQLFVICWLMQWNEHLTTLTNYFERMAGWFVWIIGSCLSAFEMLDGQLIHDFIHEENTINLLLRFANNTINSIAIKMEIDPTSSNLNYLSVDR